MILIVKRILLFVFISSLCMCIRPETHVFADHHEGYDDSGNVDVLSEEFVNGYVYGFSHYDYANIKRGMTLDEVKQNFSGNVEEVERDYVTESVEYRINDVIIVLDDNTVDYIYIEPQADISKSDIKDKYNTPSGERTENELERGNSALEYKVLPSSNFKVLVVFDADDNVEYITHTLDRSAQVVTDDNVSIFIERGLQLNNLNAEDYAFESPTVADDGNFTVPFRNGDSNGYLKITPSGQLDVYQEDGELISTVHVPFYGN